MLNDTAADPEPTCPTCEQPTCHRDCPEREANEDDRAYDAWRDRAEVES